MSDIALLGFKVDTKGLKKAEQALDRFAVKGEKTQKRLNNSAKKISQSFIILKMAINTVGDELTNVAATGTVALRALSKQSNETRASMQLNTRDIRREFIQLNKSIKNAGKAAHSTTASFSSMSNAGVLASQRVIRNVKTMDRGFLSLNKTIGLVTTGLFALGGGRLIRGLISYADTWKNINSQIRQVTKSEENLINVRSQLFQVTLDTRSELSNTVNLFAEMSRGTKDLNVSQDRLIGVTKTLNNLFVAGGKPMSETIGAIRQLNQGFASGVLRGDEFNSVAEGAPKILDALSLSLDMSRGKLREFAATGGITAQSMVTAIEAYKDQAQKLADQTEKTFAQMTQNASTNITKFVGEAKGLNSVINSLGEGMESFTENLDSFVVAAQASIAVIALGLTPVLWGYVASLVASISAQLTAGTTAVFIGDSYGNIAIKAATATVATNALGMATKFLLGPWGILLAAVGAGVIAFNASANSVADLGNEIEDLGKKTKKTVTIFDRYIGGIAGARKAALHGLGQESLQQELAKSMALVEEYTEKLKIMTDRGVAIGRTRALADKLAAEQKIIDDINILLPDASSNYEKLSKVLQKLSDRLDPASAALRKYTEDVKFLKQAKVSLGLTTEREAELQELLTTAYEKTLEKTNDNTDAFKAQIDAIEMQRQELIKTTEEFEIYAAMQEAVANGATQPMIEKMIKAIQVNQKLRKELKAKNELKDMVKDVDAFGGAWSKTGSTIINAFGSISDAMNDYIKQLGTIESREDDLAKKRELVGDDNAEVIRLQKAINEDKVNAELDGMSAIAKAGQSLFSEKTAAAKAFAALQKIIAVTEIALSFQKIAASNTETTVTVGNEAQKASASGLSAITAAFAAPWPIGFVAGAAMIGIIASLLGGKSGGGGGSGPTAQDTQGTGTIAGNPGAKSASISATEKRFEELQIDQLAELRKIKFSVDALSLGIERLTGTIVKGGGVGDFQGELGETTGRSSLLGIKRLFNKTTRKIIDSGISFVSQSLGGIIEGGILEAQSFFDILTKKKKFLGLSSSSSTSREFQAIDLEIQQQMAAIFGHIGTSVLEAAASLGFETVDIVKEVFNFETMADAMESGGEFDFSGNVRDLFGSTLQTVSVGLEEALNSFEVDIGEISLEGLSSEEIQAELEAIFSQQADLIAEFLVPSLAEYQQLGEGMFETLLRVAQEQAVFNDAIAQMGFDLSDLSNIMQIDIAQSLIGLTGGLENFSDITQTFFEEFFSEAEQFAVLEQSISEAFDSLGLSVSGSKDEFRALIAGIDLTTEEGQELLAALLLITPALADYLNELEAVEEQRTEMTIELLRLQGDAEQALAMEREIELAAMDETLRALQESIFAEQDRLALIKAQTRAINDSFSMLEQAVDLERERAGLALEAAEIAHENEITRIDGLREQLNAELTLRQEHLASAESALKDSFNAEMTRIQESANAKISDIKAGMTAETAAIKATSTARTKALGEERSALSSTASAMRSLVKTINQSLGIDGQLDLVGALAGARGGDFAKAQKLNVGGLANLDSANFASAQEMAIQQAINRGRLATISDLAGDKLSETESLLSAMEGQTEAVKAASQSQIDSIKASGNAQIDAINEQAEIDRAALQSQLDGLLGIDNTVLSIGDAITAFQAAQLSLDELNYDQEIALLEMLEQNAVEVLALHQQAYIDEMERLDAIISDNQLLLDAALGIDSSVLSVAAAINALNENIAALTGGNKFEPAPTKPTTTGINGTLDPKDPQFDGTTPPIIPDLPFDPPVVVETALSTQLELASIREELAEQLEQNSQYQQIMIRNSTTSARALQQFKYDGIDTRPIT